MQKSSIYIIIALLVILVASNLFNNMKQPEVGYSKEDVDLILFSDSLKRENDILKKEITLIELDNERLKNSIEADSIVIWNSSRAYRDSIRAAIFAR